MRHNLTSLEGTCLNKLSSLPHYDLRGSMMMCSREVCWNYTKFCAIKQVFTCVPHLNYLEAYVNEAPKVLK